MKVKPKRKAPPPALFLVMLVSAMLLAFCGCSLSDKEGPTEEEVNEEYYQEEFSKGELVKVLECSYIVPESYTDEDLGAFLEQEGNVSEHHICQPAEDEDTDPSGITLSVDKNTEEEQAELNDLREQADKVLEYKTNQGDSFELIRIMDETEQLIAVMQTEKYVYYFTTDDPEIPPYVDTLDKGMFLRFVKDVKMD